MRRRQKVPTVDRRIAKALSHPLRSHLLGILNERVASPSEMAEELGESLQVVSYHCRTLLDLECIELVRTEPRRGALEHFYRAVVRPYFSDDDWKRLPASARQAISDVALQMVWEDVSDALEAGTFDSRDDRCLVRSPMVLDDEGWRELNELVGELVERATEIEAASTERIANGGEPGFPTKLVMMHFESAGADWPKKRGAPGGRSNRAS